MPLNKNAQKLVEALETSTIGGKPIHQGRDRLEDTTGGLCCLAVACRIGGAKRETFAPLFDIKYDGSKYYLPENIQKKFNFSDDKGSFDIDAMPSFAKKRFLEKGFNMDNVKTYNSLAALNDFGFTFKEIARIIKAQPRGLFARRVKKNV